jgi:hypothetical protein
MFKQPSSIIPDVRANDILLAARDLSSLEGTNPNPSVPQNGKKKLKGRQNCTVHPFNAETTSSVAACSPHPRPKTHTIYILNFKVGIPSNHD